MRKQPEPPLVPPTTSTRRARRAPHEPAPRPRRGTLAAALALPLAGIVTVAVLMLGSADDDNVATAQTRPLAEGEVRAVTEAFADAYETEDGAALGRLLTGDVKRVLPDAIVRGRKAVVTQYETQFRDNATQSYEIDNLDVRGGEVGRASGDYKVRRALRPSLEGRIVLSVVRDRGRSPDRADRGHPRGRQRIARPPRMGGVWVCSGVVRGGAWCMEGCRKNVACGRNSTTP